MKLVKQLSLLVLLWKLTPDQVIIAIRHALFYVFSTLASIVEPPKIQLEKRKKVRFRSPERPLGTETSSNPHEEALERCFRMTTQLESSEWTQLFSKADVTVSSLSVEGYELPFMKGVLIIQKPAFTLHELLSVVRSSAARQIWDPRFDNSNTLEHYNCLETLVHSVQKGTFPVAARDFVVATRIKYDTDKIYYLSKSVLDLKATEPTNGRVRGELIVGCWIFEKIDSQIKITYIVGVDIKGNIPSGTTKLTVAIIKAVQTQTPLCVASVFKYIKDNGPLPFVVSGSSDILIEKFEFKNKRLVVAAKSKKNQSLIVALPEKLFGSGFRVTGGRSIKFAEKSDLVGSFTSHLLKVELSEHVQSFEVTATNSNQFLL